MSTVCVALGIAVFGLSAYFTRDAKRVELEHLGAEYYNIARALVDGRGFSDPFGEATGPTAWVPPIYSLLLAAWLLVLKTKTAVAQAALVVQDLTYIAIGAALYAIARQTVRRIPPVLVVPLYVLWLALFHHWFLILTTDIWLIAGLAAIMLLLLVRWIQAGELCAWRWGLLAGLATLVSPALAGAWIALAAVAFARSAQPWRSRVTAALIACCVAAPWVLRNAWVFSRFVPTKSNLGFEMYLANNVDQDGIYDSSSMLQHPYHHIGDRFEYARLGETKFIASRQSKFFAALQAEPRQFLRRFYNRLLAATLCYAPSERETSGRLIRASQSVIYSLPAVFLVALLLRRGPHRRLVAWVGLGYALAIAPYVVVAFYSRYIFPLTPLMLLFCVLGLDDLWELVERRAPKRYAGARL